MKLPFEILGSSTRTKIDLDEIAAYLEGKVVVYSTGKRKKMTCCRMNKRQIELKEKSKHPAIIIQETGGRTISITVMRSKKFFRSAYYLFNVEKIDFLTTLAPRGKTRQIIKQLSFRTKGGRVIIQKEKQKYIVWANMR